MAPQRLVCRIRDGRKQFVGELGVLGCMRHSRKTSVLHITQGNRRRFLR